MDSMNGERQGVFSLHAELGGPPSLGRGQCVTDMTSGARRSVTECHSQRSVRGKCARTLGAALSMTVKVC